MYFFFNNVEYEVVYNSYYKGLVIDDDLDLGLCFGICDVSLIKDFFKVEVRSVECVSLY